MSVLETFYILFKSDADKAADGLNKVDDAADRAEASLKAADRATKGTATSAKAAAASTATLAAATNAADANARRLATSFMSVARSVAAPLLALASVGGITNLVIGRAENIRQLDQFSAKLNSTIGDVDAFQRSVQAMGGEGARALDSLVKIGEKVNEAFADSESGARKDFIEWGLAFRDTEGNALGATDAMIELAGSIEKVSRAEGLARIKKLGIEDAATIDLLLRGRTYVENYMKTQKEMGVVTEEQAALTRDYYEALGGLGNQLTSVGNTMVTAFMPAIISGIDALSGIVSWITENQTLVEGFFIAVTTIVTARMIPAMWSLAAATLAALWPYLLMAAAVAAVGVAFALAYEDFRAWADGQPSVLGDLLGDYQTFVDSLQGLLGAFSWDNFLKDLEAIKTWWSDAFNLDGFMMDVEAIKTAFSDLGVWVINTLGAAVQGAIDLIKGIPAAVAAAAVAIPLSVVSAGGGVVTPESAYTGGANPAAAADYLRNGQWAAPTPPGVTAGQGALSGAASAPQGLATPSNVTQTSTVNVGGVTVNTQATDAAGVAAAVKGELSNQLRGTAAAFDDGVDR